MKKKYCDSGTNQFDDENIGTSCASFLSRTGDTAALCKVRDKNLQIEANISSFTVRHRILNNDEVDPLHCS